jgi:hypothetical protein
VKVTDTGGNLSGDTEGSFISLATSKTWYVFDSDSAFGGVTGDLDIEISTDASGTPVVASQTWTPHADYVE